MEQTNECEMQRYVPSESSEIMCNENKDGPNENVLVLLYADEFVCVTASTVTNDSHSNPEYGSLAESLKTPSVSKKSLPAIDTSPYELPPSLVSTPTTPLESITLPNSTKNEEWAERSNTDDLHQNRVLDQLFPTGCGREFPLSDFSISSPSVITDCESDDSSTAIISEKSTTISDTDSVYLKRRWKTRDKTLKRLSRGRSTRYKRFLEESEYEARKIALMRFNMKRQYQAIEPGSSSDTKSSVNNDTIKKETLKPKWQNLSATKPGYNSTFSNLSRLLTFEAYHSLPCYITVILYCITHISIFELVSISITELTSNTEYVTTVHTLVLLGGLGLMRFSGVLWHWINDEDFSVIKFDMQNRVRLSQPDVLLVLWFRRNKWIRNFVDIISTYLCFYAVDFFLGRVMTQICDIRESLLKNLPSQQIEEVSVLTAVSNLLDGTDFEYNASCYATGLLEDSCYNAYELNELDVDYIWEKATSSYYYMLFGYPAKEIGMVSLFGQLTFYTVATIGCLCLLAKRGFEFWNI